MLDLLKVQYKVLTLIVVVGRQDGCAWQIVRGVGPADGQSCDGVPLDLQIRQECG